MGLDCIQLRLARNSRLEARRFFLQSLQTMSSVLVEDSKGMIVSVIDGEGRPYDIPLEQVRRSSAAFWNKYTLCKERWVHLLVGFARGCRYTAMSLVLQTPDILLIREDWVGLLRFPRQEVLSMVTLGDALIPRPPNAFGYEIDSALKHMAMCFGRGVALSGDIIGLYLTDPTPDVRRWFRRLFVETAPDDRLVQEAWQPGVHPVVNRGLALLHRLTGGGSSSVLDRLLSVEVRCTTSEQSALVAQCRRAAGIVDIERPMKRRDVKVQSHAGQWEFQWHNVPVCYGNEKVYERPDERLRWVAIWMACTFSSRPGFVTVLQRTPDALLTALLPAIKQTLKKQSDNDGEKAETTKRRTRRRRRRPRERAGT